jgi:hypothetical protein
LRPASPAENAEKIREEIEEIEREPVGITQRSIVAERENPQPDGKNTEGEKRDTNERKYLRRRLALIEDIVINRLSAELGGQITKRGVSWVKSEGGVLIFDGFGVIGNRFIAE